MARKSDFTLSPIPVDAIFSTQAERDDALLERVHNIPAEKSVGIFVSVAK